MLFETLSGITYLEYQSKIIFEGSKFTTQNRNIALYKVFCLNKRWLLTESAWPVFFCCNISYYTLFSLDIKFVVTK